jgi:homoserine dehydrogenase
LLNRNAEVIAARAGRPVTVVAVSARDKNRKRDCDLSGIPWIEDSLRLASHADVDVVVELIGGAEGAARTLVQAAMQNGKHCVTANKALLATHGVELAALAEQKPCHLRFEASVAGGIPIIKTLREGMAANKISLLRGILNGTCNYILTRMRDGELSFHTALAEAQAKGYAEADPSADIDGHDTANKLAILSALAFGVQPDLESMEIEGIRRITDLDIRLAGELGYRIKLLGMARRTDHGVQQQVGPCLVPKSSSLAHVQGAMNAVLAHGDFVGDLVLEGAGAGAEPTASAVVADIIDIARSQPIPVFGVPASILAKMSRSASTATTKYYLRLQVMDKPGVVADIATILRDEAISIESLLQHGVSVTESVPVVITTHPVSTSAMRRAIEKIARLTVITAPPCLMRIEE